MNELNLLITFEQDNNKTLSRVKMFWNDVNMYALLFPFSGLSVLYFMVLVFLLFQNRKDVRLMIEWIFPDLKGVSPEDKVMISTLVFFIQTLLS